MSRAGDTIALAVVLIIIGILCLIAGIMLADILARFITWCRKLKGELK